MTEGSMLNYRSGLVGALLAFSGLYASADQVQFTLPYNEDVIRELGGSASSGLGAHGEAYVTQSYAAANDSLTPRGLPDSGLIKDVRLGPYNGGNAVLLAINQWVLLARNPPGAFLVLHVYVAA